MHIVRARNCGAQSLRMSGIMLLLAFAIVTASPSLGVAQPDVTDTNETIPFDVAGSSSTLSFLADGLGDIPEPDDPELCPEDVEEASTNSSGAPDDANLMPDEPVSFPAYSSSTIQSAEEPAVCDVIRKQMAGNRLRLRESQGEVRLREEALPIVKSELEDLFRRINRGIPISDSVLYQKVRQIESILCELKKWMKKVERLQNQAEVLRAQFVLKNCSPRPTQAETFSAAAG